MKIIDDTKDEGTTTTEETIVEEEEEVEQSKWNFENALIFSFTVITTIGEELFAFLSQSINSQDTVTLSLRQRLVEYSLLCME